MKAQGLLFDTRSETRPLRKVVSWKQLARWKSQALLDCGYASKIVVGNGELPKRMRCTPCGQFGEDENGLKYKVPNE